MENSTSFPQFFRGLEKSSILPHNHNLKNYVFFVKFLMLFENISIIKIENKERVSLSFINYGCQK
jgi:hypothetical protein